MKKKRVKSNVERFVECLTCKYCRECNETVEVPEDYEDGLCKTKREFEGEEQC